MHVVIGGGLAGLSAALWLDAQNEPTTLVSFGLGGLTLSSGTIDVMGYAPERVAEPLAALEQVGAGHPYAGLSGDQVRESIEWVVSLLGAEYLTGDVARNVLLPTAVGGLRPSALYSPSAANGIVTPGEAKRFVVVGFRQHKDFQTGLIAGNLVRNPEAEITARSLVIDLPARVGEADASALTYARRFDDPAFRASVVAALAGKIEQGETVLMPALLGLDPHTWERFQEELGHPVAEVPLPPPNVLGVRLQNRFTQLLRESRIRVYNGSKVAGGQVAGTGYVSVAARTAGHDTTVTGDDFLYCAGGFESGALELDSTLTLRDTVLGLPVHGWEGDEPTTAAWDGPQPLFLAGLRTDATGLVTEVSGKPAYDNVYAAGGALAGAIRWQELSGEGIAIATALRAARSMKEAHRG